MYRFLLGPRWIALTLAVIALVAAFGLLARWQYDRNVERGASNDVVEQNLDQPPKPVSRVLDDRSPAADTEWTPVTVTGRYDAGHELLVRYRYLNSAPGFEVLTPLRTADGRALLVDRGWVPAQNATTEAPDVPPPPAGEVTVTGRVRASEHGPANQVRPETGQVRFVDVGRIGATMPYPLYGGYVELAEQRPAVAAEGPTPLPAPELDPGPHLSYAVQWCLFSLIAIGGWIYLVYDEARGGARRRPRRRPAGPAGPDDPDENGPARRVQQLDGAH